MALKSTRYRKVEPAALNRRATPRHDVEVTSISLNGSSQYSAPATLVDISIYGCRLNLTARLNEGEEVEICFATFNAADATVVWTKDSDAGCRFAESLDPKILRALTITH